MLTWPHLHAVANEICRVSLQLYREARRLERERRSLRRFRRTDALPRVLVLSDQLEVAFTDQLHVRRRAARFEQEGVATNTSSIEVDVEYHAIAEVRHRSEENGHVVAFHFTTMWPRLDPRVASPEARVSAQQALRRVDAALQKTWKAWPSWDEQARAMITASALPALEVVGRRTPQCGQKAESAGVSLSHSRHFASDIDFPFVCVSQYGGAVSGDGIVEAGRGLSQRYAKHRSCRGGPGRDGRVSCCARWHRRCGSAYTQRRATRPLSSRDSPSDSSNGPSLIGLIRFPPSTPRGLLHHEVRRTLPFDIG